jgi:hypothetical protein
VSGRDDRAATGLTPEERLQPHRERSGPVMEKLHTWLQEQFAERKVGPNSGLGRAITHSPSQKTRCSTGNGARMGHRSCPFGVLSARLRNSFEESYFRQLQSHRARAAQVSGSS